MASVFSRTGSTSNRRSANIAGARSRASISRAEDSEAVRPQDSVSSAGFDHATKERSHEKGTKRFSHDFGNTERRLERKTVLTKEQITLRSPIKGSAEQSRGGDVQSHSKPVESPVSRNKKQAIVEEREFSCHHFSTLRY